MPSLNVVFTGNAGPLNTTIRHVVKDVGAMRHEVAGALGGFAMQAAGVYGVEEAMRRTVETAKDLVTTSKRLGIGVEQLQLLRQAAKDSSLEFSNLAAGIEKIDVARAHALGGGAGAANYLRAFQTLGVTMADLKDKTAAEIFTGPLSATIKKTNPEEIAGPLREVFGRGFGEFVPVLKTDFDDLGKKMRETGALMKSDIAAKLTVMANEFELVSRIVTAQLAPALLAFAEWAYKAVMKGGGNVAGVGAYWGNVWARMEQAPGEGSALSTKDLEQKFLAAANPAKGDEQGYLQSLRDNPKAFEAADKATREAAAYLSARYSGADNRTDEGRLNFWRQLITEIKNPEAVQAFNSAQKPFTSKIDEFNAMLAKAADDLKNPKFNAAPDFSNEVAAEKETKRAVHVKSELTENQRVGAFAMSVSGPNMVIDLTRQTNRKLDVVNGNLEKLIAKPGGIPGYGGN